MLREGRAGLVLISLFACLFLNAAAPLNPTVKVVKHPKTAVPAECEEGLAPQVVPPTEPVEVPEPPPATLPTPSASLRDLLRVTQSDAAGRDRDAFNDAFARVNAYPSGSEKSAAADVIRVYDDLSRLWTYEFETPSGAFFDSSSGLLAMLSAYPGYQKAIEEQTLNVGGTKLYPSRESRDFLVREAASRLSKLGIRQPATTVPVPATKHKAVPLKVETPKAKKSAKSTTTTAHVPSPTPVPKHVTKMPPPKPKTKKTVLRGAEAPPPPRGGVGAVAPQSTKPKTTTTTTKTTTTATTTVAPVPPPTTTTVAPPPPPIATTTTVAPPTTTTVAPPTTTTVAPPTTTTVAPPTTTTIAPTTTTIAPAPAPEPKPTRNVILPIILIVIGIGVLIVLFRASS